MVVLIAARMASREGRPPRVARNLEEQRLAAAPIDRLEHCFRPGIGRLFRRREEQAAGLRIDLHTGEVERLVTAVHDAGMREQVDEGAAAGECALDAPRPDDRGGGGHHRIGRIAGLACRLGGDQRGVADEIHFSRDRDVEHGAIVFGGDLVHQRQGEIRLQRLHREIEHGMAVDARHLGPRVHDRRAGLVLHVLARDDGPDLLAERGDLQVVRRKRLDGGQGDVRRKDESLVVGDPGLEREAAAGVEVRRNAVELHHRRQRRRDVRDVGDHGALGRNDGTLGREQGVDAEGVHEPVFLVLGPVARSGHGAGMAHRAGELGFPAADHAGDHRLAEIEVVLVIAAGFGIEHRGLAAVVVLEGVGEIARGVMDVDVLAGGDQRGRAPPFGREILRNRRGEAAGIRKDRDRALEQRFLGKITPERTADADAIP